MAWTLIDHQEWNGSQWDNGSTDGTIWQKGSIPVDGTYDHLLVVGSLRSAASAYWQNLWIRVGGTSDSGLDTGANFSYTNLTTVNLSSPDSYRATGQTKWAGQYCAAASVLADTFSTLRMWIPNYANTDVYKQAIIQTGVCNNVGPADTSEWNLTFAAGLWADTEAITDIGVSEPNSGYATYTDFSLYGLTGA
jgi:hypothetical protein